MDRRRFLTSSLLVSAGAATGWELLDRATHRVDRPPGPVRHLLPAVTDRRMRIKFSLAAPAGIPPVLRVDGVGHEATRTDRRGRFWLADVDGLDADRAYELELTAGDGGAVLAPWTLRTLPAPDARPERLRILAYTCAGGSPTTPNRRLGPAFLPVEIRRRLLRRALSFEPDVVVANGDHVYWDLGGRRGWAMGSSPMARWNAGLLDRGERVLGTANEDVLVRAVDPQIAELYGTMLRSVPVLFIRDDHDYTENDDLVDGGTFPADRFMHAVASATQRLYYPEFLPADGMPQRWLDDEGVAFRHGALRYGRLFEGLAYDARGELTTGPDGAFLAPATERWLLERLGTSPADHVAQFPSAPVGWSAGKWLEWYPDVEAGGRLAADRAKPGWSSGWLAQHDRLLAAAGRRGRGVPMVLSGDLHATAAGWIHRSGELDLGADPVLAALTGTLGTAVGWPSAVRGVPATVSGVLDVDEVVAPVEHNGFTLLDVRPGRIELQLFTWPHAAGVAAIDHLEPARTITVERPPS